MKADGRPPPVGARPIRAVWRVRTDPQRCLDDPIHGEDGAHEPTDPIDRVHVHIALTIGLLCHEALIHAGARLLSVGLRQTPRAPSDSPLGFLDQSLTSCLLNGYRWPWGFFDASLCVASL